MPEDSSMKGNLEINHDEGYVVISINPKVYPLDIVLSSAYAFTERYYCLVDGDPNEEIIVELRPKDRNEDLEEAGRKFNNELILYACYAVQTLKNQVLREAIIDRVMMTNYVKPERDFDEKCECPPDESVKPWQDEPVMEEQPHVEELKKPWEEDDEWLDDPEGIAVPWEEKYGDKDEKSDDKP